MKKLLYITPHLSTGGLPQYLLKKIETFNNQFEIWCIEWSNISEHFIVQKNKIKHILGSNLITLGENKFESLNIIGQINPDIIHIEEIPETFIDSKILDTIYGDDRNYNIVVTTHSSQTNPETIKYKADRFVLVSEWSKDVFTNYFKEEIPCDVWEYPIEKVEVDKTEAKKKLGFDPNYKHVLNVGLFTPGKNQGELIELAKQLKNYPIKFHFVGNQAMNFQNYWKPLMKDLPDNCIIHGEKSNVEDYLAAADVFYFTSNLELNPLVVKEALSFSLPTFIKKLPTYKNNYDGLVEFITNNMNENIIKLTSSLSLDPLTDDFFWGDKEDGFKELSKREIFTDRIYERFFTVESGDIVVDLGASVGPFTYSILNKNPEKCFVVEPLQSQVEIIKRNLQSDNVEIIRAAITDKKKIEIVWESTIESPPTLTFDELIENYNIEKIDFLKCDCEGGEYDVFQEKNIPFLRTIPKIVTEFHLREDRDYQQSKFKWFRDKILPNFNNYRVFSVDGVDIKWDLFNQHFLDYYNEVLFYIDNR